MGIVPNRIGYVRESASGVAPSTAPSGGVLRSLRVQVEAPALFTYLGMRPYYRRRMRGGSVRVYLRSTVHRATLRLDLAPDKAALVERGKSYTIESGGDLVGGASG